MAELKVGGEVDSFCTKCKMVLAHTVLAIWAGEIKRVRCNTCMGEHAYRRSESSSSGTRATGTSASKPKTVANKAVEKASVSSYDEMLRGRERAGAKRYNTKEKYAVGELVEHVAFGLGVVAAVRGLEKIDIAFPSGVKTLLHNKGAAPTNYAKPPAPKSLEATESMSDAIATDVAAVTAEINQDAD